VDATGQTAVLSVPDASCQMMAKVSSVMPRSAVRLDLRDYTFAALHASAAGKVYLADLPPDRVTAFLARPLPSYTPRTLAPEALLAQLAEVRQRGYAVALGEHMPDTGAVAVAVREARGQLVGALALAGQVDLFESAGFEEWLPPLRATAARLAEMLYAFPTTLLPSAPEIVPQTRGTGVPRDETKLRKVFRVL
jgi:DNA-binding IclR family transcriptional regulator